MIGAENLAIGVSLYMRDTFTASAARAGAAMQGLKGNADRLARANAIATRNTAAMGAAVGIGILGGIKEAYKGAAEYNYLINYVSLIGKDAKGHFTEILDKSNEVANSTMFDPNQVAEGMKYMAQAGVSYADMMNSINSAANLGMATMSDLGGNGGAADIMTSMINGWNMDKTEKGFAHMADALTKAVNGSKTTLGEFGDAMKYTMGTANHMNMGFEETAAGLMMLSNMGMRGSIGGVAMSNFLQFATRAAGGKVDNKQGRALASLGLSPKDLVDAKGGLIPIGQILQKIQDGGLKVSKITAENARHDIFGVRGGRALTMADDIETYYEFLNKLKANDGHAQNMATAAMNTEQGRLDMLQDNWIVAKNNFGTAITSIAGPIVRMLTQILNVMSAIMANPFGKLIVTMITGFIFLKTLMLSFQAITLTIGLMQSRIGVSSVLSLNGTTAATTRQVAANQALAASLNTVAAAQARVFASASSPTGYRNARGQFVSAAVGRSSTGFGGMLGRIGSRISPGMMMGAGIGGMALNSVSESSGGNSTKTGVGLGVAGDTLQWAATGAMVGSMVPVIGTAIGGIVGGVAALGFSLYHRLGEYNDIIKDGNKDLQATGGLDLAKLKREYELTKNLSAGQKIWREEGNMNGEQMFHRDGSPIGRTWDRVSTSIVINMDGKQVMRDTYTESDLNTILNLGLQ